MKWLVWLLILVLECPLEIWRIIPEHEREQIRILAVQEHCQKRMRENNETRWRIRETIKDGFWQLHIQGYKTEV